MDCSIMSVPSNSLKLTDPIPCAVVIGVGAQQGIGAAVARRFADAGLKVYVVGRTLQKVENVAAEIRLHGGTAIAKSLDAEDAAQIQILFDSITHSGKR
jgi:NADP-dependent 3-hydroxy acid dehydrogenase YdfG